MTEPHDRRGPPSCAGTQGVPEPLIVVERRPLIGRWICSWISSLGPEFDPIPIATIDRVLGRDILGRARGVILGTGATIPWKDEWLTNQIACIRTRRREIPLVLLTDAPDLGLAQEAVKQLHLSGYIPTSSSPELAATALRLVIAGGRYIPASGCDADQAEQTPSLGPAASKSHDKLTARERAVLELLERGLPNKIIAYRLEMSQSTVKAHVHNIIVKLNVRNRTEAAVASYVVPDRSGSDSQ